MKYILPIVLFALPVLAQTPVPTAVPVPSGPSFPWADNTMVVLIVTGALGILSLATRKIPGAAGKVVNWLVDLFSANVKH